MYFDVSVVANYRTIYPAGVWRGSLKFLRDLDLDRFEKKHHHSFYRVQSILSALSSSSCATKQFDQPDGIMTRDRKRGTLGRSINGMI